MLLSPARIEESSVKKAQRIAEELIDELQMVGVLAVEMFYLKDGSLLINEIAPRPHNSGHQTIEGNVTSQYKQHLLAITGQPLGDTSLIKPSVMINLLGHQDYEGKAKLKGEELMQEVSESFLHYYHKQETRPYRKMGHITVLGDSLSEAMTKAQQLKNGLTVVSEQA
jgi:5-(carboxyamino)imidazole ribonucleotide synthase